MKTVLLHIFTIFFALGFGSLAQAANLEYSPSDYTTTIAPGTVVEIPYSVTLVSDDTKSYFLWFKNRVEGSLPPAWLTTARATTIISPWSNTATTTLRISVPETALPGVYEGVLYSKAMASHGFADPGEGINVRIVVAECSESPTLEITSAWPEVIWPPNHRMDAVTVEGVVSWPEGCLSTELGYAIDDEYGVLSGVGTLTTDATGYFSVTLPVEASRLGKDRDGRHYRITVFAANEAGTTETLALDAVVPHDMRPGNR